MTLRQIGGCLALIIALVAAASAQRGVEGDKQFQAALHKEMVDGDLKSAIEDYRKISTRAGVTRDVAATALVRMAECYEKLGDAQARAIYERIVRDYSDQAEPTAMARARLGETGCAAAGKGDRAVWTGPKVDLFGRVAPDGCFISFIDWTGSNYGTLALRDLRSNTDRALTDPKSGEAQWSAVSPDSQSVAYAWFSKDSSEVRIMPVSGSAALRPRTLLTFSDGAPGVRDWSPDGKLLAVGVERGGTNEIVVATVADKSMRVLKTTGWRGAGRMFFSRDSRYIAFDLPASDDDNVQQRDVFILKVDGSGEVRAVADDADDRVAGWSPDGRYLLFSSTRTGARSLWALPVSDGRPQGPEKLVKTDIGSSISLGVTNSGALYLHKYISDRDVKIAPIDLQAGTIVGPPVHLPQGLLSMPMRPRWSPDGRFLAYQVRGEEEGLAIRSAQTGEVHRMRNLQYAPEPRWSPDGRSLITGMNDSKGRPGIFKIDVQSRQATLLVRTSGGPTAPRWSADGTKIYYNATGSDGLRNKTIRERDLRTEVERDIFRHPLLEAFSWEMSPDNRHLVARTRIDQASQTSSVLLVPVTGGEPRELMRVPSSQAIWPSMAWTPDSRSILTARKSGVAVELVLIEAANGSVRKLNIDVSEWDPVGTFALSADGRSIAFLMGKSGAEVWAMENFLLGQALKR